jgi:hypothetical protein
MGTEQPYRSDAMNSANGAVAALQRRSVEHGTDTISPGEIDAEIRAVRKKSRR